MRGIALRRWLPWGSLLLVALVLAAPLWGPGLVNTRGGGDSPFLFFRLHQLGANLRAGVFPARWMPDAAYGLGYPFFNHYAALPYYAAAVPNLLGVDLLKSIQWVQTLGFLLAPLGLYGWARRRTRSRWAAWLAAAAYGAAPFHLVNVYVRGDSLSEFWAFVFYPLILWAVDLCLERGDVSSSVRLGLAYGGLVLTHNGSAMIFTPFALLYGLIRLIHPDPRLPSSEKPNSMRKQQLTSAALGLTLGLLLSAWFWLPALGEARYVQLETVTEGYFRYAGHFRAGDLVQPSLAFDYAIEGRTPFAMGLVQALLAGLGAVVLVAGWIRRRRLDGWGVFVLVGLSLSTLMITPLSRPLWDHLPLLPFVQFPWRFLSVQALFAALAIGYLADSGFGAQTQVLRRVVSLLCAALLTAASLWSLHPDRLHVAPDEVTPERLQRYEWFTENIGTTITYEYLPKWTVPRPYTGPALVYPEGASFLLPLNGRAEGQRIYRGPTWQNWQVEAGEDGASVAFPLLYWPGWEAMVDGQAIELRPVEDLGWAALDLPPGEHHVSLSLARTRLRILAENLSLIALVVLLVLVFYKAERVACLQDTVGEFAKRSMGCVYRTNDCHSHESGNPTPPQRRPACSTALAGVARGTGKRSGVGCVLRVTFFFTILSLSTLPLLWPAPHYAPDDLTWDFDRQPYPHHNPDGIEVGGAVATGYTVERERLGRDLVYTVSLNWEAWQAGQTARVALVPPGAVRRPEVAPLTESEQAISSQTVHRLVLPYELPFGPLLPRLSVASQALYLQPVQEVVYWRGGPPQLDYLCHSEGGNERDPLVLDVRLDWCAAWDFPLPANDQINLRLRDSSGLVWANLDTQPGYGYLPTSLWMHRLDFSDYLSLPLVDAPPPGDYQLDVTLYRVSTLEPDFQTTLPIQFTGVARRPEPETRLARLGDLLLVDLSLPQAVEQGASLPVTAHWWAAEATQPLSLTWSLRGAQTQTVSATLPGLPQGGYVSTQPRLSTPASLPPGQYELTVAVGEGGSYTHPAPVEVQARARQTEVPPLEIPVEADFCGLFRLWGYDLAQEGETVRLKLHWGSLAETEVDYKFFVHLLDPAGNIVTQHDGMPQAYTYPTSLWAPGEVVGDQVSLSLAGLAPGSYRLALGWYDEARGTRLEVAPAEGWTASQGRLFLNVSIVVP